MRRVRALPIVLTDVAEMPLESINFDKEESITVAMQNRPDLKQATQSLDVDDHFDPAVAATPCCRIWH